MSWGKRIMIAVGLVLVLGSAGSSLGQPLITGAGADSTLVLAREAEAVARVVRLKRGAAAIQNPHSPTAVIACSVREMPLSSIGRTHM